MADDTTEHELSGPFNVVAAFRDQPDAQAAAERLAAAGVPRSTIHTPAPGQDSPEQVAEMRAEMQDEITGSWASPSFFMTGDQARGAAVGTFAAVLIGAGVGLLAGLAWAFWFDSVLSEWVRVVLGVGIGILAIATAGFLAGGGLKSRVESMADRQRPYDDQRTAAERMYLVGVHSADPAVAEQAGRLLAAAGADRVDLVDESGTPLPAQAHDPRPADPAGYWWRRAGEG